METAQFLARVIPPGPYFAVSYNKTPGQPGAFSNRFFAEGEIAEAASFIRWAAGKGFDTYHAMASFQTALADGVDQRGRTKWRAARTQENVHALRAFWIDLDVKRDGDKKGSGDCYATRQDALLWLAGFRRAVVGLPAPNMVVNSGYGLHAYWILEDAMPLAGWQPYADALKAALAAHGFTGDAGISSDAARVLRPPGTLNAKGGRTAPVDALPRPQGGEIPNALMTQALQPYVGVVPLRTQARAVAPGVRSALAGGQVSSIFANAPTPNMAAAAAANMPVGRTSEMARIATRCEQVAGSLARRGGLDPATQTLDTYPLWYLGHLTLAHFCSDGAAHVHAIGDGHPNYTMQGTDAAVAQIAGEVARKGSGPPTCAHYDRAKPGVCGGCRFKGTITTPWELGYADDDLPHGYRRHNGRIQVLVKGLQGDWWQDVMIGDVSDPHASYVHGFGYRLVFRFTRAGNSYQIAFEAQDLSLDKSGIYRIAQASGILLPKDDELPFRTFILAWIDQLTSAGRTRQSRAAPFGWATEGDKIQGFALAGTLHTTSGGTEMLAGAAPAMVAAFTPKGTLQGWQEAFNFITPGRPDLQALVACSFAAPLMRFTGHAGVAVSAWSHQSGVGKSSALTIGQAVWGAQTLKNSLDDTPNSVFAKVATLRTMPCFWDEARVATADAAKFTQMLFTLTQGKGKSRMNSDTTLREVGEWETVLVLCSNHPLMDFVTAETAGTEAGAVRVFEYPIEAPPATPTMRAANVISQARDNYGHAGLAYAKWLAINHDKAAQLVQLLVNDLNQSLKCEQSERLHVAAMATMLAGALIATRLGLAGFQYDQLRAFLIDTFETLRSARRGTVQVSSKGYDLEQIFNTFMAEMMGRKIITDAFAKTGRKARVNIEWAPQNKQQVDIQVSLAEEAIRFSRSSFTDWCHKKKLPGLDIIAKMESQWGAKVDRHPIAAGTGFGSGKVLTVEISTKVAGMEEYLIVPKPDPGTVTPAQATVSPGMLRAPPPAQPGASP